MPLANGEPPVVMVYVGLAIVSPVLYSTVTLALSPGLRLVKKAFHVYRYKKREKLSPKKRLFSNFFVQKTPQSRARFLKLDGAGMDAGLSFTGPRGNFPAGALQNTQKKKRNRETYADASQFRF